MPKPIKIQYFLFLLLTSVLAACAAQTQSYRVPAQHPEDSGIGKRPPICVDCHEASDDQFNWQQFNHTPFFADNHRQIALRNEQTCAMCHQTSFCNDCHATGLELKPSLKNQTETYRRTPHRGDYLSRHRIDGRVDPSSCFRCHRNPKASGSCVRCHG
jgi:hypothetical protein